MAVEPAPIDDKSFGALLAHAAACGAAAQYGTCLAVARQLLADAQACQAQHIQAAVWLYRAWPLARQDDPVRAVACMHRGLALMHQHVPDGERPVLLTSIGLTYRALGLPVQALVPLRQAFTHFSDSPLVERRLRGRDNLIGTLLDAFDQLSTFQAGAAAALLDEARALLPQHRADTTTSGRAVFTAGYWHTAAAINRRGGRADQARDMWLQLDAMQAALPASPPLSSGIEELLERALTAQALSQHEHAAALAREARPLLPADAQLRLARELLWASQLADLSGDAVLALALYRRFHARVIGNEHAAFEARVDELAATVKDQSLQLAVSNLQRRNAGLVSTFQQLSERALTDTLTDVANRRGLQDAFDAVQVAGGPLVLAMIDLDHFKRVNDEHSHVVGDRMLQQIASLMRQALREADFLARFGGEEFTALLVNTQLPEARAVAERLRVVVQTHDWQAIAAGSNVQPVRTRV